jgi:hypothetical protein
VRNFRPSFETASTSYAVETKAVEFEKQETPIKRRNLAFDFEKSIQHESQQQKALYWATINALTEIGAPAVPHLIQYLSFNDLVLAKGVRLILSRIGKPAVDPLIQSLATSDVEIRNRVMDHS